MNTFLTLIFIISLQVCKPEPLQLSWDIPSAIREYYEVKMRCGSNLFQRELYTVKWFKDGKEFFRYTSILENPVETFEVEGVHVVAPFCDKDIVVLENLSTSSAGQYKCEINSGSDTLSAHSKLHIIPYDDHPISTHYIINPKPHTARLRCYFIFENDASQDWIWRWYKNNELFYTYDPSESVSTEIPKSSEAASSSNAPKIHFKANRGIVELSCPPCEAMYKCEAVYINQETGDEQKKSQVLNVAEPFNPQNFM